MAHLPRAALAAACLTLAGCNEHCDPAKVQIGMTEAQVVAACGEPTARSGGGVTKMLDDAGMRYILDTFYLHYEHADGSYDLVDLRDNRVYRATRNPPLR